MFSPARKLALTAKNPNIPPPTAPLASGITLLAFGIGWLAFGIALLAFGVFGVGRLVFGVAAPHPAVIMQVLNALTPWR